MDWSNKLRILIDNTPNMDVNRRHNLERCIVNIHEYLQGICLHCGHKPKIEPKYPLLDAINKACNKLGM